VPSPKPRTSSKLDRGHSVQTTHTLASREGAALWQWKSGARDTALTALQSLLTDRVRILGPDHHHTLSTRHKLAHWRGEAGHYDAAVIAFQELLADQLSRWNEVTNSP
jgi:Tetratricopeptide repeat